MRFIYTSIGLLLAISGETIALKVGDVVLKQWVENVREYAKWNAWARTREELDSLVEAPPERLVKFLASVEVRKQVPILCRHLSQGSESSLQVAESLLGIPFGIMNDSLRTQFCTMVLPENPNNPDTNEIIKRTNELIVGFQSRVGTLTELCGTSADVLVLIMGENYETRLDEYEGYARRLKSATEVGLDDLKQDVGKTLCSNAVSETDPDTKEKEVFLAKLKYIRNEYSSGNWRSQYEKKCAKVGAFVQLQFHSSDEKVFTDKAFEELELHKQLLFALCELLSNSRNGGDSYPYLDILGLIEKARILNSRWPELRKKCSWTTLEVHTETDLDAAEQLAETLSHKEKSSLGRVCEEAADRSKSLAKAIEVAFKITDGDMSQKRTSVLTLYYKCSATVPLRLWGSIPLEDLDRFEKVVSMDLSEDVKESICSIFADFLKERASFHDHTNPTPTAFEKLESIAKKHKRGGLFRFSRRF